MRYNKSSEVWRSESVVWPKFASDLLTTATHYTSIIKSLRQTGSLCSISCCKCLQFLRQFSFILFPIVVPCCELLVVKIHKLLCISNQYTDPNKTLLLILCKMQSFSNSPTGKESRVYVPYPQESECTSPCLEFNTVRATVLGGVVGGGCRGVFCAVPGYRGN